jgi:hypothetical protein
MLQVIGEDQVVIPKGVVDLASFRQWTYQDDFPENGRIDFINGSIEIDLSPEQLFAHGRLKVEISGTLLALLTRSDWMIVSDSTRIASIEADLSAEPDIAVLSKSRFALNKSCSPQKRIDLVTTLKPKQPKTVGFGRRFCRSRSSLLAQ